MKESMNKFTCLKTLHHNIDKKKTIPSFLTKTYQMIMVIFTFIFCSNFIKNKIPEQFILQYIFLLDYQFQNQNNREIISFNDQGNAFVISNPKSFSDTILPHYFKHNQISSFIRQLNMYGFKKIRNVYNQNEFSHKYFIKDQEELLERIERKGQKSNESKKRKNIQVYTMMKEQETKLKELSSDMQELNTEIGYIYCQLNQFGSTTDTLQKSMSQQQQEINGMKQRRGIHEKLYYELVQALICSQVNQFKNQCTQQYQSNTYTKSLQTTKSNGSGSSNEVDNGENQQQKLNSGSSKEYTNQSNEEIEMDGSKNSDPQ